MARSPEEIKARCFSIINNKELVSLVEKSSSPSAAYEMVFAETKDIFKAKAGRDGLRYFVGIIPGNIAS